MEKALIQLLPELQRFAISLTNNKYNADDLVQETLCKALTHKSKFKPGTNLRSWVWVMCRNNFIDSYRKERLANVFIDDTPDLFYLSQIKNEPHSSPDAIYNEKELLLFIEQLQPKLKVIFKMYLYGYRYDEMATLLGTPIGTIKNQIFRAREILKENIKFDNLKYISNDKKIL